MSHRWSCFFFQSALARFAGLPARTQGRPCPSQGFPYCNEQRTNVKTLSFRGAHTGVGIRFPLRAGRCPHRPAVRQPPQMMHRDSVPPRVGSPWIRGTAWPPLPVAEKGGPQFPQPRHWRAVAKQAREWHCGKAGRWLSRSDKGSNSNPPEAHFCTVSQRAASTPSPVVRLAGDRRTPLPLHRGGRDAGASRDENREDTKLAQNRVT